MWSLYCCCGTRMQCAVSTSCPRSNRLAARTPAHQLHMSEDRIRSLLVQHLIPATTATRSVSEMHCPLADSKFKQTQISGTGLHLGRWLHRCMASQKPRNRTQVARHLPMRTSCQAAFSLTRPLFFAEISTWKSNDWDLQHALQGWHPDVVFAESIIELPQCMIRCNEPAPSAWTFLDACSATSDVPRSPS